jgi:glycosyltransferase involved in cell wall biosynthesis
MASSPDRLRVLMVVQRMLPYLAGAELQAVGLAGALGDLGVEVHFVSTRYAKGLPARGAVRGRAVRRLPVVRGPLLKPSQLLSTAAWVGWKARGFDLVHAHCLSAASLGASMGAQLAGVPVLVKPSLAGPDGETAKLLGHPLARRLLGVLRRVSRFAALDAGVVGELTALGIEPHRIEAVDNGVDLRCFRPAAPGERIALRARFGLPAGPIAVFAGQLVARKGIAETIDAWRMIAPSLDDPLLIVAGDGPEEGLVRRAAADPAAHVRYVGSVDEVADMMRASDAFVLPSRNESFGNAMLEAMASGLPVVVGRTGLAARLDIDPGAGRALDRPDAVRIASALREVLTAADRSAHLGVRGRRLAEGFDYARVARRYLDIYRSMIGRQPA